MAWVTPRTWTAGELVTASIGNVHWRDNLNALRTGGIAIASQGANEIIFASSATQLSRSASFTYDGSILSVATFGAHAFAAGGTGPQSVTIRNTSAGTGNSALLQVQADQATRVVLETFASNFTTVGGTTAIQASTRLETNVSGGLSIDASHATTGMIRFYTNSAERMRLHASGGLSIGDTTDPGATNFRVAGTSALVGAVTLSSTLTLGGNLIAGSNWISGDGGNEGIRIDASGSVYIGDTTNANVTVGLTINQGANDDQILALKSSDVAHGVTDVAETDTYAFIKKESAGEGGLFLGGLTEGFEGIWLSSTATTEDATRTTGATGAIYLSAGLKSGTARTTLSADRNMVVFANLGTARFILDSDGDSHQDVGTAWTNFDEYDDVALLTTISAGVSRKGDPLRRQFGALLKRHRRALEQARIVTFNRDGHHFVNWSRLNMLKVGAIRQLAQQVAALTAQMRRLEMRA